MTINNKRYQWFVHIIPTQRFMFSFPFEFPVSPSCMPSSSWAVQLANQASVSVFQEEEMPEVEIDIDDLLEVNSDDERASKLQVCVSVYVFVPTWLFLANRIYRIYTTWITA